MMSPDSVFSRTVLAQITPDVRKHVPGVRLLDAWVYKVGPDHWEFHYGEFYWHGTADNAYDARARGWSAYLTKMAAPGYRQQEEAQ